MSKPKVWAYQEVHHYGALTSTGTHPQRFRYYWQAWLAGLVEVGSYGIRFRVVKIEEKANV